MAFIRQPEPTARRYHAAFRIGQYMYIWAGVGCSSDIIERFNISTFACEQGQLDGYVPVPLNIDSMAVACDENHAYFYGGRDEDGNNFDSLYCLDMSTFECTEISPANDKYAPGALRDCRMVYYDRKLMVYGGRTENRRMSSGLLFFSLDDKTWSVEDITGDRPPGVQGHTLTMIDSEKYSVFGGYGRGTWHNETYLLDLGTKSWSLIQVKGRKPAPRSRHTTLCIDDPTAGHHSLLMTGGRGGRRSVFSDVWLLNLINREWTELSLPTPIIERWGHTTVLFGTGPDFRVVAIYGGKNEYSDIISEITLLLLSRKERTWVIDRVVSSAEWASPDDTLREQMKRLQIFAPLSDERAQQIIDKALQESSVDIRNIISVLTGLMGAGKTCLLSRVFNRVPPSHYTSTGVTEQSFRGFLHHVGTLSSWEMSSNQKILEFLANVFHQDLPPVDMMRLANDIVSFDLPDGVEALSRLTSTTSSTATSPSSSFTTSPLNSITPNTPKSKSDTTQSIMRLVQAPKGSQGLTMLELIHMIDTGGQPEYMENMPSLIHNCHLAFLVVNLQYDVDDYPPIHYHENGKEYKRELRSQYSNRQIIQKLAATLQAKRFSLKEGQCFRLISVATHRDCLPENELSARIEAYHQALKSILLPANDDELIFYSLDEIPFVVNLKNPDNTDIVKLDLIREKVKESEVGEVVKTPGAFLIFEQELVEYAKTVERNILSLEECLEVGARLKMGPEMAMSALIFYHRQFTFLYFHNVLPNVVFIKPQVPLDCINTIVQFNYKVKEMKGVTKTLISSLRDGIITEEILKHQYLSKCFIPDLYEPQHAIDLFCHTLTLASLSHEPQSKTENDPNNQMKSTQPVKREKREYLMMSLRQPIPDKDIQQYIPTSTDIAPFVIQFTKNCVPLSCFSRTISCLLSMYDWKLSRAEDHSPECLAHNIVSLYDSQLPVQIILRDATSHLEIHVRPDKGFTSDISPKICFRIRETVFSAIKQVFDSMKLAGITISPAFICPCSKSSLDSHFASLHSSIDSKQFLRCSKTEKNEGPVEIKHTMWLDSPVTETVKPSIPKLLQFNLPEKVGVHYYKFGILLLNDEDGTLLEIIDNDCLGKCERIIRKILTTWLQGRGKPVSWSSMVETLRSCNLTQLAEQIEKKTQ